MCKKYIIVSFYLLFTKVQFSSNEKVPDLDAETDSYNNTLFGDNSLWDGLFKDCGRRSTYSCVQSNVYGYLEQSLSSDFYVTDGVYFTRNDNKYSATANTRVKKDNPERSYREDKSLLSPKDDNGKEEEEDEEIINNKKAENNIDEINDDDSESSEFNSFVHEIESIEGHNEMPYVRRGKVLNVSENEIENEHNLDYRTNVTKSKNINDLTDILYNRGVEYLMTHDLQMNVPEMIFGGAKVKISPRGFDDDGGALIKLNIQPNELEVPQQEGRIFKKIIQKFFKKKLMSSFLAAMLIIKLLKVKAMFLLPVIFGVGTAKKILLKTLLFIFPALAHLFKLCSYYHKHHTKYHHHHHQVAHHHHHIPVPVPVSNSYSDYSPYPSHVYDSSGPGGYFHSRTEEPSATTPDLASWGLGDYPSSWDDPRVTRSSSNNLIPASVTEPTRLLPYGGAYQQQNVPLQYGPTAVDYKLAPPPHRVFNVNPPAKAQPSYFSQSKTPYAQALTSRLQTLTPKPAATPVQPHSATSLYIGYDPFYSPILQRLDSVFVQLGFNDETCRERLVCSMYKSPTRFSPHSNLVSAEISRDPTDLQKPVSANGAALRFFRYVQAARDGQDLKDCLRLYPACAVNTER